MIQHCIQQITLAARNQLDLHFYLSKVQTSINDRSAMATLNSSFSGSECSDSCEDFTVNSNHERSRVERVRTVPTRYYGGSTSRQDLAASTANSKLPPSLKFSAVDLYTYMELIKDNLNTISKY